MSTNLNLVRWNPLKEIDDLFARAVHSPVRRAVTQPREGGFTPLADIAQNAAGYRIELEVAGFSAADVDVSVHDGVLTISGNHPVAADKNSATDSAASLADDDSEDASRPVDTDTWQLHRRERSVGGFERRFRLPEDADVESVRASAKDGVLTLMIDRRAELAPRSIEVQVA